MATFNDIVKAADKKPTWMLVESYKTLQASAAPKREEYLVRGAIITVLEKREGRDFTLSLD